MLKVTYEIKKNTINLHYFVIGFIGTTFAGPYDDWPDNSICGWLEQKPTHAGYLGEAKKRSLTCKDGKAIKGSEKTTTTTKSTSKTKSKALYC